VNYKWKSRRRFFLLTRSRTPPISSEFRGVGGVEHPKPPLSVRHWTKPMLYQCSSGPSIVHSFKTPRVWINCCARLQFFSCIDKLHLQAGSFSLVWRLVEDAIIDRNCIRLQFTVRKVRFSLAARFIDNFHTRAQIEHGLVAWFCQFFRPLARNNGTHGTDFGERFCTWDFYKICPKIPIKVKMGQK